MILPAVAKYLGELSGAGQSKGIAAVAVKVTALADQLVDAIHALENAQHAAHEAGSVHAEARAFKDQVIPAQNDLRAVADELETLVSDELWPLPEVPRAPVPVLGDRARSRLGCLEPVTTLQEPPSANGGRQPRLSWAR